MPLSTLAPMNEDLIFTIAEELRRDLAPHFPKHVCEVPTKPYWCGPYGKREMHAKKCVEIRSMSISNSYPLVRVSLLPLYVCVNDETGRHEKHDLFEWADHQLFEKVLEAVRRMLA